MKRSWFTLGFLVYALLCIVVFPLVLKVPMHLIFDGDAAGYNLGAVHLLQSGFYSMDGVTPFFDREPGMSFFLLPIYTIFGAENGLAIVASQIVVYFLAAWAFCHQLARSHGQRVAGICFLLLLTSGSVFHSIFSAYRECLALVLLLLFSALILANDFKSAWWKTMLDTRSSEGLDSVKTGDLSMSFRAEIDKDKELQNILGQYQGITV
jgi:hypothetical protein